MAKEVTFHPVQLSILDILNHHALGIRYSEIYKQDIENDLFNYHLQKLVKQGLIVKESLLYSLTTKGKQIASNITSKGRFNDIFKYSVTVNIFTEIDGIRHILVQKRHQHPAFGDTVTIAGKISKGELIEDAAKRKLTEETGLICDDIQLVGVLRKIRYNMEGRMFDDVIYNVCYGENPTGELITQNSFGENFWMPLDDFMKIHPNNLDVGPYDDEVYTRLGKGDLSPFYFQQVMRLERY